MAESCPLGSGKTWSGDFPETCLSQCELSWEIASSRRGVQEHFVHDDTATCRDSNVRIAAEYLEPITADTRRFGIVQQCTTCAEPAYADVYEFSCPGL